MEENDRDITTGLLAERRKYERLFCGCAFINPRAALERCAWVQPEDFLDKDMAEFWKGVQAHGDAMRAASEAHVLLDLSVEASEIPTSMYPETYSGEMARLKYLGEAMRSVTEIVQAIGERDENLVRNNVAKLHSSSPVQAGLNLSLPSDINDEFILRINAQSPSLLTGLDDLDNILGGMFTGELTILAARPGIGKTSLATAIAKNVAVANKSAKILFLSLEMDKLQLWARMACARTPYSWKDIRSGRASPQELKAVQLASEMLRDELGDRLVIVDDVWDVPGMINICAKLHPDLVVIDHLSEIRWKDENADEVRWFGRAAKLIRTEIARRMHIPTILIHQLNRGVEGRDKDSKRPVLSDLKWSGDLEAIADIVIMLYREDYYDDDSMKKPSVVPMEMWIRKNRQGVMNACAIMNFDTRSQQFSPARASSYITTGKPSAPASSSQERIPMVDKPLQMWYDREHDDK